MTKIQGLDRLKRKLAKLPAVAKQMIRQAMEAKANEIVAMMKNLVPVDDGTLRDSIGWTWGKAPKGSIKLGKMKSSDGKLAITIYAGNEDAYYARWVEFGTNAHSVSKGAGTKRGRLRLALTGGGLQHPGAKAQPFFFVSWRANKRRTVRAVRKASRDAAKKVAAGS